MVITHRGSVGRVEGYASVFDIVDAHADEVIRGAFARTLAAWRARRAWPAMLWQHSVGVVVGQWMDMHEDSRGLWVMGQLHMATSRGRQMFDWIRSGVVRSLSIGFRTLASTPRAAGGRRVEEVDLREISFVTDGANSEARVTTWVGESGERRVMYA